MQQLFFFVLAILCGAVFPTQAGLNAQMARLTGQALWAAFFSFIMGVVVLFLASMTTRTSFGEAVAAAKTAPWYVWFAGVLGAYYISTVIVVMPRLGVALTFGLVVLGQMIVSLLLDHYGWLGVAVKPISIGRIVGAMLIVGGVVLIRKF